MIAQPKKTKEERKAEKEARKKAKPKKKRGKETPPNSKYWMKKCDDLFMKQGHNQPCAICKETNSTCYHHIVAKSTCKALRYDIQNMLVLCPNHHNFSNEIAAHSTNAYAQRKFMEWLEENKPKQYKYCQENQHNRKPYKFKELYSRFKEISEQGGFMHRSAND